MPGRRFGIVIALLIALTFAALFPWIPGLIGAPILAVCGMPVHRIVARTVPRRLSAALVTIVMLAIVLVPGVWLVSTGLAEANVLVKSMQTARFADKLAHFKLGALDIGSEVGTVANAILSSISGRALSIFGSAARATMNAVIAFFGAYYLLADGDTLWGRVLRLARSSSGLAEEARARFVGVTEAMLLGVFFTALLQGTLVGAAFAVVGFRAAVFWGMVTAAASIFPVLGSALVWLPGMIVLVASGRYGAATFVGIVGAVFASNLDNLVRIVVYRRVSNIHPMLTLVGAFAGVGLFGWIGILIGPLALTYVLEMLKLYESTTLAAEAGRAQNAAQPIRSPPA